MFFFFKQKTAYEMRISYWSSDVSSSDLFTRQFWGNGKLGCGRTSSNRAGGWRSACNRGQSGGRPMLLPLSNIPHSGGDQARRQVPLLSDRIVGRNRSDTRGSGPLCRDRHTLLSKGHSSAAGQGCRASGPVCLHSGSSEGRRAGKECGLLGYSGG